MAKTPVGMVQPVLWPRAEKREGRGLEKDSDQLAFVPGATGPVWDSPPLSSLLSWVGMAKPCGPDLHSVPLVTGF